MSILKDTGLDWRDRFLIKALYLDQTASECLENV